MMFKPCSMQTKIILGTLSVICMLAAYTWLAHEKHHDNPDDKTIPLWSQIFEGLEQMTEVNPRSEERWLLVDAKATSIRLFYGLFYGFVGAFILGLTMGCFAEVEAFLAPPINLLAKIPPTAALAVFFALIQSPEQMFVFMIAFGIMPIMAQSIYLAVKDLPEELINKSYTLGASKFEIVWNIVRPAVMPKIIDAFRLQIGPAMVYLIAAEMLCAAEGFGYRIRLQMKLLNMSLVYPYLALLAGFGFVMDYGLRQFQRIWCPWYTQTGGAK